MDELKYCIVLFSKKEKRLVDKCSEIASIEEDKCNNKYVVTFLNGSAYTYNKGNIRIMENPNELYAEDYVVYHNGKNLTNVVRILCFGEGDSEDWIKIVYNNGTISSYPVKNLTVLRNRTNDKDIKNYIFYLKNVADIIKDDFREDYSFLKEELNKLKIIEGSVLSDFIDNKPIKKRENKELLIFPFSANSSQIKAVKNALCNNISCIQGPPGTGKTQTILNIIANLLVRNKKIAVVAGNNEATKNVKEKLADAGLGGIDAYLGKSANINLFFDEDHPVPQFTDIADAEYSKKSFNILAERALKIYSDRIKKAKIESLINEYQIEQKKNNEQYMQKNHNICDTMRKWADDKSSQQILNLAAYLEILSDKRRIGFYQRIKLHIKYNLKDCKQVLKNITANIDFLQNIYYQVKIKEINKELSDINNFLMQGDNEKTLNDYRLQSMYILKQYLSRYYKDLNDLSVSKHMLKCEFEKFVKRYPIIYSTTHALRSCSGDDYLYDYVIMDESSQVDLLTASIAMSCAKNIVFVGDQKQLPHVVRSQYVKPLKDLFSEYSLPEYHNYIDHSILSGVIGQYGTKLPNVLLNEHYRCDSQIIGFCNKRFYNDELVIQTGHTKGNGITIITNEAHCETNRSNQRQVKIITQEILPYEKGKNIGVVAPYCAQVELLTSRINDEGILVDTVHKFQGKERDVMILSTVSDKITFYDDERSDFLNNENLINVAISRARKKLYVVASREILKQEGTLLNDLAKYVSYYCTEGEIKESKTYSVFDLMYDEYNLVLDDLKNRMLHISQYPSENIIATVLNDFIKAKKGCSLAYKHNYPLRYLIKGELLKDIDDRNFVENQNTHCDFLIYDRLDKSIKLAIEVDGRTHTKADQIRRDEQKNKILEQFGIPVLRLKTTDCCNSYEINEKIKEKMN